MEEMLSKNISYDVSSVSGTIEQIPTMTNRGYLKSIGNKAVAYMVLLTLPFMSACGIKRQGMPYAELRKNYLLTDEASLLENEQASIVAANQVSKGKNVVIGLNASASEVEKVYGQFDRQISKNANWADGVIVGADVVAYLIIANNKGWWPFNDDNKHNGSEGASFGNPTTPVGNNTGPVVTPNN